MAFTMACTVRVPCLSSTLVPGTRCPSASQAIVPSMSWVTGGTLREVTIRSPREMSMSSASRSVTDWGANASVSSSPAKSMPVTVLVRPLGCTVISSPTRTRPEAIWPA